MASGIILPAPLNSGCEHPATNCTSFAGVAATKQAVVLRASHCRVVQHGLKDNIIIVK